MTTAEHEAAHAVPCMLLGHPYLEINTIPDYARGLAGWVADGRNVRTTQQGLKLAMLTAAPAAVEHGRTAFEE